MVTKKHWVCLACGYIYEGDTPPEKCPICKAPKRAFYGRHEIPSPPPRKTVKASTVKEEPKEGARHWVCLACGHIHEGGAPPEKCPICKAPKKAFMPRQYYK